MTKPKKHPLDETDPEAGTQKDTRTAGVARGASSSIGVSQVWLAMLVSVFVLSQFGLPKALAGDVRPPLGPGPRASTQFNLPVIRAEEDFLRARFPEFEDYCRNVPQLFPRFKAGPGGPGFFSAELYWKHREYNAAIGAALMVSVLIAKALWFR